MSGIEISSVVKISLLLGGLVTIKLFNTSKPGTSPGILQPERSFPLKSGINFFFPVKNHMLKLQATMRMQKFFSVDFTFEINNPEVPRENGIFLPAKSWRRGRF